MSIWRRERVADDAPPTLIERFRARHPVLARETRLSPASARIASRVVVVFLTKDDVERYLFAAPILVVGLMAALAKWNDL